MTMQEITELAQTETETELNTLVYEAILAGQLSLEDFLEYQAATQGDVRDAFAN